jgi:ribosome-binding protein aMBF1 (putative translation factor)
MKKIKLKKKTSWVDQQLKNKKWKKGFEEECIKLSIAEGIARVRKKAGLTQKELAEKIGSSASAMSRYENSNYDRYEVQTLLKIANACGSQLHIRFCSW